MMSTASYDAMPATVRAEGANATASAAPDFSLTGNNSTSLDVFPRVVAEVDSLARSPEASARRVDAESTEEFWTPTSDMIPSPYRFGMYEPSATTGAAPSRRLWPEFTTLDRMDMAIFAAMYIAELVLPVDPERQDDLADLMHLAFKEILKVMNLDFVFYALHLATRLYHPDIIDVNASSLESLSQFGVELFKTALSLSAKSQDDHAYSPNVFGIEKARWQKRWRFAMAAINYDLVVRATVLQKWYMELHEHPLAENFCKSRLRCLLDRFTSMPAANNGLASDRELRPACVALVHELCCKCPVEFSVDLCSYLAAAGERISLALEKSPNKIALGDEYASEVQSPGLCPVVPSHSTYSRLASQPTCNGNRHSTSWSSYGYRHYDLENLGTPPGLPSLRHHLPSDSVRPLQPYAVQPPSPPFDPRRQGGRNGHRRLGSGSSSGSDGCDTPVIRTPPCLLSLRHLPSGFFHGPPSCNKTSMWGPSTGAFASQRYYRQSTNGTRRIAGDVMLPPVAIKTNVWKSRPLAALGLWNNYVGDYFR